MRAEEKRVKVLKSGLKAAKKQWQRLYEKKEKGLDCASLNLYSS